MKIRVSHILQLIAVLFFIAGVFFLWKGHPAKATSYEQAELYKSPLYSYLVVEGKPTKAWVIDVDKQSKGAINLYVNFFTENKALVKATIYNVKVRYESGEFINILYSASNPQQVRLDPAAEISLGWAHFGWCMIVGFALFLAGSVRRKKSGGLE